ncbi:formate-dependent nitrite reductase, periplasmic cytochrome c552 subunit [Candidatus Scalindua japonica]|uniref:Formate-dependent nitrite reductase, periplasmic cytochrome c552 subunit n=1 Tax=Candidatus Scalindua japonica TaxID=1284222 RepID=A0A286TTS1_9BACT|nr:cytochrome c3 family protein [Candidatus Scalindua japonica]GAX59299.1 formate-dependent nitrite reductase, periplasmic cytochrome c552 subunit [Candidatus Scalindua japonica]
MYKYILIYRLFITLISLSFFSESSIGFGGETLRKSERIQELKRMDTCTVRCHVNYMAYENKFEVTGRPEIFRHQTHSFEQHLDCTSCHDNSEVNTENHGKLIIKKENCLQCHHVELKGSECNRCHKGIDEYPMKYKEKRFIHGFTVESGVDCSLCHVEDQNATLTNEEINCVKCHHTTPNLDCVKCHKDDMDSYFNTDPQRRGSLSWTVSFRHTQHTVQDLSCRECHSISHDNYTGILEYDLNCSKCHHISDGKRGCIECHKIPSDFINGKPGIGEVTPLPDMMFRAVKCDDCHRYNDKKLKFRGVEEYCIECHNEDYGKLYKAWTQTIKDRLIEINRQVQTKVEGRSNWGESGADDRKNMDTFPEKAGSIVDVITKYGIHNYNLTRILLDNLEEKIQ